jgi:hypothetical protein
LFIYCRHGAGKSRGQYRADERAANGVISASRKASSLPVVLAIIPYA